MEKVVNLNSKELQASKKRAKKPKFVESKCPSMNQFQNSLDLENAKLNLRQMNFTTHSPYSLIYNAINEQKRLVKNTPTEGNPSLVQTIPFLTPQDKLDSS
jgi:hypothetical protein